MSFLDTVRRVVDLARRTKEYYDAELPKHHRDYPLMRKGEVGPPPPPSEDQLATLMGTLPDDSIYRLMALMYLGRGDFMYLGPEHFAADALPAMQADLERTFPDRQRAIEQILSKVPLANYLELGLAELAKHGIDAEHPHAARVQTSS